MRRLLLFLTILISGLSWSQEATLVTQERNLGIITCIDYSPDGQYVASGSEKDNKVKIWDIISGKLIGSLVGHEDHINDVAFNTSGSLIASADVDKKVYIWDLETWARKDSVPLKGEVQFLGFADESTLILVTNKEVQLRKVGSLGEVAKSWEHKSSIVAFAQNGNSIAVADKDNLVNIYDLASTSTKLSTTIGKKQLTALALTDKVIIAGDESGAVHRADLSDANNIITNKAHGKKVIAVAAHSKSPYIVSSAEDKTASVLKAQDLSVHKSFGVDDGGRTEEEVRAIEFSPDGGALASSGYKVSVFNRIKSDDNVIRIWDVEKVVPVKELKGDVNPIQSFCFHPMDNVLYTLIDTSLNVWNLNTSERLGVVELEYRGKDKVEMTAEEKQEDVEEKTEKGLKGLDKLRALKEGKLDLSGKRLKDKVEDKVQEKGHQVAKKLVKYKDRIYMSPKANYLITDFFRDELRVYKVENDIPVFSHNLKPRDRNTNDLAIDPRERYVALAGEGTAPITLCNLETGRYYNKLYIDFKNSGIIEARSLAFDTEGKQLAVVFNSGRIIIWETEDWNIKVSGDLKGAISRDAFINFSKDGKNLYVKTLIGTFTVNASDLSPLGKKQPKVKGAPAKLHQPSDYIVSTQKQNLHFFNGSTMAEARSPDLNTKLITAVEINKFGYVGVSMKNGELRVYDPTTGKERFIMVSEGDNAIFKTPENYYKVTKEGTELVTFRVGKDAYPFEQFDAKYNRPDIVLKAMNCEDEGLVALYAKAYEKRLKKLGLKEEDLAGEMFLPEVLVENRREVPVVTDQSTIKLKVKAMDGKYPLAKVVVWINDVPVYTKEASPNVRSLEDNIDLTLAAGKNKVQVSATNTKGVESLKKTMHIQCNKQAVKNLYLMSIGTSKYQDDRYSLNYAAKDAKDLATLLEQSENGLYNTVHQEILTNEEVKRDNFKALREFLEKATIDDVVIVFIAGHGVLDAEFDYYYGTHDMNFESPADKGLAYTEIESILNGIKPIRKLLIMDTCHSGEVEKDEVEVASEEVIEGDIMFRAVGNGLREKNPEGVSPSKMSKELFSDLRRGTGTTVLSSAGGAEFAMESDEWKNGLFTYSLLFGLRTKSADIDKDGKIMLSELQQHVTDMVTKLSHGKQVPTTRIQNISLDYQIW